MKIPHPRTTPHPFFEGLNWEDAEKKALDAPFQPAVENDRDTSYFDDERRAEMRVVPFSPHASKAPRGFDDSDDFDKSAPPPNEDGALDRTESEVKLEDEFAKLAPPSAFPMHK